MQNPGLFFVLIANAFYKSGYIREPNITKLIKWNTDRLVQDIIKKKREQLIEQIKAQAKEAANKKMEEELQKYRNLLGGPKWGELALSEHLNPQVNTKSQS
jgi:hypothetical protein